MLTTKRNTYGSLGYSRLEKPSMSHLRSLRSRRRLNRLCHDYMRSIKQHEEQSRKASLYDDYMRLIEQHEEQPRNPKISNIVFEKGQQVIKNCNETAHLTVEEITVYFNNQPLGYRYAIVFLGGVIVGLVLMKLIPVLLIALEQAVENIGKDPSIVSKNLGPDGNSGDPKASAQTYPGPSYGEFPDGDWTWTDLFIFAVMRVIYIYVLGGE